MKVTKKGAIAALIAFLILATSCRSTTDEEPFTSSSDLAVLAREAEAGTTRERALQLYSSLWRAIERAGLARDTTNLPRGVPPRTAGEVARLLSRGAPVPADTAPAGCLELTALYVAAARLNGITARMAERVDGGVNGGQVGHVVAAVELEGGGRMLVDLANGTTAQSGRFEILQDAEARGLFFSQSAAASFLRGDYDRAQREAAFAHELAPRSARPLINRAAVFEQLGRFEEARADAEAALSLSPSPFARVTVGRILRRLSRFEESRTMLAQAITEAPGLAIAHLELGKTLCDQGEANEAESEIAAAGVLDVRMWEAHRGAALLALARGSLVTARSHAARGRAVAPSLTIWSLVDAAVKAAPTRDEALVLEMRELGSCARWKE